jgi:hypothetical protein
MIKGKDKQIRKPTDFVLSFNDKTEINPINTRDDIRLVNIVSYYISPHLQSYNKEYVVYCSRPPHCPRSVF